MLAFRDETARRLGMDLLVHVNESGLAGGVSPIASGFGEINERARAPDFQRPR
jgi:hypothetical protein